MLLLILALAAPAPEDSVPVASLFPIAEAEITKALHGCLDERPYPDDAGPLCFSGDGHYRQLSGWGTVKGQYTIEANHIALCDRKMSGTPCLTPRHLTFYRDQNGKIYYHYGTPKPVQIARRLKMSTAEDLQR
jgi:hypothetical protein